MPRISLNMIWIGTENFTSADRSTITQAIIYTGAIYGTVGVGVDRIEYYEVSVAEAGGYDIIFDDDDQAVALTEKWTVDNNAIDVFLVKTYTGPRAGLSDCPGPCNKNLPFPNMTGVVVELVGMTTYQVLAHEVGHYLGLAHEKIDTMNLMYESVPNGGLLTAAQGAKMKTGCFIEP